MQLDMTNGQFSELLDWTHPTLANVARTGDADHDAIAAAAAIRKLPPATLTVPQRVPATLDIWQRDYPDDIETIRTLLDRTIFSDGTWQPDPASYTDLCNGSLRSVQTRRHHAVVLAGRLFALTGDRRYADAILDLIRTYIAETPPALDLPKIGYAEWAADFGGVEVVGAAHVIEHWLQALPLIHTAVSDQDYLLILKALAALGDAQYRCWNNVFYFNYCLHGIKACASIGLAFPQFTDAAKWLAMGSDRFFGDLCRPPLCLEDGCTREGLSYQEVNAHLMTKWYLLCHAQGIDIPQDYTIAVQRIMGFAATFVRPDGSRPQQGEAGPSPIHEHYMASHKMLQVGAALFSRDDWRTAAGSIDTDRLDPEWLWSMGPDLYETWRQMPATDMQTRTLPSTALPHAKYAVLRHGQGLDATYAMLVAADPFNHAHHDTLHLDLYAKGRLLLSDSGCGSYQEDVRLRDLKPHRHNTIQIDKLDPAGPNRWPQHMTRQVAWIDNDQFTLTAAEHDLFLGFRARRIVTLVKPLGCLVLYDHVWATEPTLHEPTIDTFFHFHAPESELGIDDQGQCWSQHEPTRNVWLYPAADLHASPDHRRGPFPYTDICRNLEWSDSDANLLITPIGPSRARAESRDGWLTINGGTFKRPAVRYHFSGSLPARQAYVLLPFAGTTPPPNAVTGQADHQGHVTANVISNCLEMDLSALLAEQPPAEPTVTCTVRT